MNKTSVHTINVIARALVTIIWVLLYFINSTKLTDMQRSLVGGIVLADIITWIIYQIYLLPKYIIHLEINMFVNIAALIVLIRFANIPFPESPEWFGIAIMVFMIAASIKAVYYYAIEVYLIE